MKSSHLALLISVLLPAAALAQDYDNGQPARGSTASADLEVRLSAMEDALRDLRGQVEQDQFQIHKLQDTLDKMQKDTEFRFNQLSGNSSPAMAPKPPASPDAGEADSRKPFPPEHAGNARPSGPTSAGDGILHLPDQDNGGKPQTQFASPREHYNYAMRLHNQTQYEAAAASFADFIKKYPKDPLIGNAYFWEGESYYIRGDYPTAADLFRRGFEAAPDGPKAADNLLRLAFTEDALNHDKEACVILEQIVTKYKKSSSAVTDKAYREQMRIGCK